jgi:hypothetical protein
VTDPRPIVDPQGSRPTNVGDVVASVILLIAGGFGFALLAVLSALLAMVSDGCGPVSVCNFDLMGVGYVIALAGPPLVYLSAAVWTIVRLTRRQRSWWIPILGAAGGGAVWGVGYAMLVASIGR